MQQHDCPHCAAGLRLIKTKRQWMHWSARTGIIVCKRES